MTNILISLFYYYIFFSTNFGSYMKVPRPTGGMPSPRHMLMLVP
jgi:hypothetical protein